MRYLPQLFENNRIWANRQVEGDPEYFERLCGIQRPGYLWIGCSDSRVPANTIVGLAPGEVFVHRNVANIVSASDANVLSVVQYAVDILQISHIIVCGHYGCGGIQAAFGPFSNQPLEGWISGIRTIRQQHEAELAQLPDDAARWKRLCELNVITQVRTLIQTPTVTAAWSRGQPLDIHGWIYDLHDGLLKDLEVSCSGLGS
ncbi:MAG: carbonic anhydrase [Planctomycetota bacterium]